MTKYFTYLTINKRKEETFLFMFISLVFLIFELFENFKDA